MHPCATILGEILDLSRLEEKALAQEDVEQAEQLAERRSELLTRAWLVREGYDKDALWDGLLLIEAMQERLHEMAMGLHEKMTADMYTVQQQSKYFTGTRHLQAQNKRSNYCDEVS